MNIAPIVLFVYNRIWHTKQTVEALKKNEIAINSELFIYSDASKNDQDIDKIKSVREYIKTIDGFKKITIIERKKNWGLAKSIIDGVTNIINQYGKIIVVEDDIVTSPYFLQYMNEALDLYKYEEKVVCVHGYFFPVINANQLPQTFFVKGADCWGWATWKQGWDLFNPNGHELLAEIKKKKLEKEFDFNNTYSYTKMLSDQIKGKNDSWAIRWYASAFLKNKLTLYPNKSLVQNIGNDKSGVHCKTLNKFNVKKNNQKINLLKIPVVENDFAKKSIEQFFRQIQPSFIQRFIKIIKSLCFQSYKGYK